MRSPCASLCSKPVRLSTLLLLPSLASAFYLPGVAPTDYDSGDVVPLQVNRLVPKGYDEDPTLRSTVSYPYYTPELHFCAPEGGAKDIGHESLGAVLFGDRIQTSPFELKMLNNEPCKRLCEAVVFDADSAKFVNERIRNNYAISWLVDGLPAGQAYEIEDTGEKFYTRGFPLGQHSKTENAAPSLNNHYDILVNYHPVGGKYRVVGVQVRATSRANNKNLDAGTAECGSDIDPLMLSEERDNTVTWTYSVTWEESQVTWAVRWDNYLHVQDPKIHWFALINSSVIVIFFVSTVSAILTRALKKDFARYNRLTDAFNLDDFSNDLEEDGIQEDSGWKLVHGDVFRPPLTPLLLSVLLGNGAQIFLMAGTTILFALLGFLSPSNRGSLATSALLLWTLFSFIGGYVSSRMYKTFGGEAWKRNIVLTPVFVPVVVFSMFFSLNFLLWIRGSSGAVPFSTMLVVIGIWFLISVPLSFGGSWLGFRSPAFAAPVRTNQIPRQIPPTTSYLKPLPTYFSVGFWPFGAILVELYFILNSLWFGRIYYMFGFLFLAYGVMIVTCASVTIMFVYYLLCAENYRWQWRAFNSGGAGAFFVFLFAVFYWIWNLRFAGFTSVMLYLGYSALISFLFYILTGSIGFFASWMFVHRIYASIRVD